MLVATPCMVESPGCGIIQLTYGSRLMSSEWSWCAGFVNGCSQDEVWEAIRKTIEGLTDNEVRAAAAGPDILPRFDFTAVAPAKDNWGVFWNWSWRFCSWVFKAQKLTGIIGYAWIDSFLEYDPNARLDRYTFSYFIKGVMTDWFVLEPVREFRNWGYEAIQDLLVPYFETRLSQEELTGIDFADAPRAVEQHLDLFASRKIVDYRKQNIGFGEAEELLNAQTLEDLYIPSKTISLPFFGPAFTIDLIASVMRMHYDNVDWQAWLFPILETMSADDKRGEWSDLVTSLRPMWFQYDDWQGFHRSRTSYLVIDTSY